MPTHQLLIGMRAAQCMWQGGSMHSYQLKTFAEVQVNRDLIMKRNSFLNISIDNDSEWSILNCFRQSLIQAQEYIGNLQHSNGGEFHTDYMGFATAIVLAYYNADEDDVSFDLFIEMGERLTDSLTFTDEEDLWLSTRQLEERLKHIINLYYFE